MQSTTGFIFDMDGLLIDSEPLWRIAEPEVFNSLGVPIDESMCFQTVGLRIDEVVDYWYARFPWTNVSKDKVIQKIINRMNELLIIKGQAMPGAVKLVRLCRKMQIPLALATSSPMSLVITALKKLDLTDAFDVLGSAETEEFGKPHPAVYLSAAHKLGINSKTCVAFEDSITGIISAKAAQMRCIAVPAQENRDDQRFAIADAILNSLELINYEWLENFLKMRR